MVVIFKQAFDKKLQKLSPKLKNKVYEKIELFEISPYDKQLNNHALAGKYSDCRSINISGNYRAIFYQDGEIITFINIGTHSQLY